MKDTADDGQGGLQAALREHADLLSTTSPLVGNQHGAPAKLMQIATALRVAAIHIDDLVQEVLRLGGKVPSVPHGADAHERQVS